MKKLVLTIAIVLGMTFAASAQRAGIDYDYSNDNYDGVNIYNYGDMHRIEDYGDNHYVGSHFINDDEKDDILTRFGLNSSISSTSRGTEYYGYEGVGYYGGGLFGRGATPTNSMNALGGSGTPLLPIHGQTENQDAAPLGSGVLLFIGFGAAYALSKRNKK